VERIDVEGTDIAFERWGHGPPVVLLHGILQDGRAWRPQLEGLAADFTVVAWDAPGCGGSSDPPGWFRMPDYAGVLASFIRALGLDHPHVVGLSLGAVLGLELYRREPALPATLVLASAYAGWAGSLPPDVVAQRLEQAIREADLPPERFVPEWIPGLLTERAPSEVVDRLTVLMSEFHPVGYRTMAHALAEADLRGVLPTIDVPTLLLYGEEDKRSPLPVAEALHAKISSSTLVVIPKVGHLTNIEAPDRFNAEVRNFILRS
jgi:pimeloyl-ACP methyl ester carboxylesterase